MPELDRDLIHSLLREIYKIAETCSLTNSMAKSAPTLVEMYNRLLRTLAETGDQMVLVLFRELNADATVDEIGASAALLARYVRPEPHRNNDGHGRSEMRVIHLGPDDEPSDGDE